MRTKINEQKTVSSFKIKLKKGDTVVLRSGKDKGKTGVVSAVHPKLNAVTVDGLNIVKRHTKPSKKHPAGGILEVTKPISVGKLGIIDPSTKKASRIKFSVAKDGVKTRVFAQSGKEIK